MTEIAAIDCIQRRTGRRPIVVVAPHGGRRHRALRRGDGINDLYTAEIAAVLAERLDAFAIINHGLDRNDVDLNRISELVERAPSVLSLLRQTLAEAEGGAGAPLVLLVHGWNVSSLHCDIGIGLREIGDEIVGAYPTISFATLKSFVVPLRSELAHRGLSALIGHRYAASGADNATQLFSGRHRAHADGEVAGLSQLASEGRVDAVQLELSIALRWPGVYRERLLDALVAAVEAHVGRTVTRAREADTRAIRGWAPRKAYDPKKDSALVGTGTDVSFAGESLQAVLADGSGLFMAIESVDHRSIAARVCVARTDGRLALFVCEAPYRDASRGRFEGGGLSWQLGGTVRFAGPVVLYPTHEAFLDLEEGLRHAELADVEVLIEIGAGSEKPSTTAGYVRLGEETQEISGAVVRRNGGRLGGGPPPLARLFLTDTESGEPLVIEQRGAAGTGRVKVEADGQRLVAEHPSIGELCGTVIVRVPVYRPTGDGLYLAIVFGVVELDDTSSLAPRRALFETVDVLALSV